MVLLFALELGLALSLVCVFNLEFVFAFVIEFGSL